MFGGVNVWRTAELKVIGKNFGHKDAIYQLKLKFGKSQTTRQIHQTLPPPNILASYTVYPPRN